MKKFFIPVFLTVVFMSSCNDSFLSSDNPPAGEPGSLIIVTDDHIWEGPAGDTLTNILEAPVFGLPLPEESLFDTKRVRPEEFNEKYKTSRNVLRVYLGVDYDKARIEVFDSPWARTQCVVDIEAPDLDQLLMLIDQNKELIVQKFLDAEKKRHLDLFEKKKLPEITRLLNDKFHVDLAVPSGYALLVKKNDFAWIQQNIGNMKQIILVYTYPCSDSCKLNPETAYNKRNEMGRDNVPGSYEGSHLTISPYDETRYREYKKDGKTIAELRGQWRMSEGYDGKVAMGGPFVNISQVDMARNRIVSVDVMIYRPNEPKRNFLVGMEAIQQSLKVLD